ncbi:MAG: hypothetical protein ABJA78_06640 [Ferruginibacter sp.]
MPLSFKDIAPFLNNGQNKLSRWIGYFGLGIGMLLLLASVQMYFNINELLKTKSTRKNGYDYISITKTITNENMGKDNRFHDSDIADLKTQQFIDDAAPLKANQFKVSAGAGETLPFNTEIFVEAINKNFLDTIPPDFTWQENQELVPIIFSTDFLEMYNVFAPSWDLPQLSEKTAASITIFLKCHGRNGERSFKGHIVAFSERINSVLVPENFLDKLNNDLEGISNIPASRVFLKTKDANNPELLNYLENKNYHVNKDKTKFGRLKKTLQAVVSGMAGFGILVILLAFILFSFYLQLVIERSKSNLQLMFTLGYSPKWLSRTVAKKWIPVYTIIVLVSIIATSLMHFFFQQFAKSIGEDLSPFIDWTVIAVAAVLLLLSVFINYRMLSRLLNRL